MTGFQQAMTALLTSLGLPVYLAGHIPGSAPFPYVSCTMGSAAFGGPVPITATAWFLGRAANTSRAALCDKARILIPEEGVKLAFDGGMAVVRRAAGEFISLVTDATEPRSVGARIRLTVTLYDL